MSKEIVKDNQWWFGDSALGSRVDGAAFIVLSIEGRECALQRSDPYSSGPRVGQPTMSFKFLSKADREFWFSMKGQEVEIHFVDALSAMPDLNMSAEDEPDDLTEPEPPAASPPAALASSVQRTAPTAFDAYVFVDWSASSRPCRNANSIWIATGEWDANGVLQETVENPTTRQAAHELVLARLRSIANESRRVLVGFDFAYGYPGATHALLAHVKEPAWSSWWSYLAGEITDEPTQVNNRFSVADRCNAYNASAGAPFWARPIKQAFRDLHVRKSVSLRSATVAEFRRIEVELRARGKQPKSVWQLLGNGSVGSQSLLGIPRLHALRADPQLEAVSAV